MSYDPSGIYNLPPVYKAEPGTTIRSEQHNSPLEDIAQALSFVLVRDGRNGMVGPLNMGSFPIRNVASGSNATDAATISQTVPIGTVVDFALPNPPAGWVLCYGQALPSNTPYPLLRQALLAASSPYGVDGSGNPRVPDARGRVVAGKDDMGGTAASRLTGPVIGSIHGNALGNVGGEQAHVTTVAEMPAHNHGGVTGQNGAHAHSLQLYAGDGGLAGHAGTATFTTPLGSQITSTAPNHVHGIAWQGGSQAHNNVQPTIIMNKIIKAAY